MDGWMGWMGWLTPVVKNGYYGPGTDTSAWPEGIYRAYYYDRDTKELQKHMEWSHITRILPLDVSEDALHTPDTSPNMGQ